MTKTVMITLVILGGLFFSVFSNSNAQDTSGSSGDNIQFDSKTEYFAPRNITSTATITGPVTVPPGHSYDIILDGFTTASMSNWRLYCEGILIASQSLVFDSTVHREISFPNAVEGSYRYEFWFRGIQGVHTWPDFTRVFITVTVAPIVQPPAAPTNLVATAVSAYQIDLTWQDNSDNEQGFIIERRTEWGAYEEIATVEMNVTNYGGNNLLDCALYAYRIRAYNQSGISNYSNEAGDVTFCHVHTTVEIIGLLDRYYQEELIKNYGIYNSLSAKLTVAGNFIDSKNYHSALGQLNALSNELNALKEKSINSVAKQVLSDSISEMTNYITFISNLPVRTRLYLVGEPHSNENIISCAEGDVVTTLVGNFTIEIAQTNNPDIASLTIIDSEYAGTPLIINGINSGTLWMFNNPDNQSVGTLNLKTWHVDITENVLVKSYHLKYVLGISDVPMEIKLTGVFCPMKSPKNVITVCTGIMPLYLPPIGGGHIFGFSRGCPSPETAKPNPGQESLKTYLELLKDILGNMPKFDKIVKVIDGILQSKGYMNVKAPDVKVALKSLLAAFKSKPDSNERLDYIRDFVKRICDMFGIPIITPSQLEDMARLVRSRMDSMSKETIDKRIEDLNKVITDMCSVE